MTGSHFLNRTLTLAVLLCMVNPARPGRAQPAPTPSPRPSSAPEADKGKSADKPAPRAAPPARPEAAPRPARPAEKAPEPAGEPSPKKAPAPPPSMTPSAVKPKLHHRHQVGVDIHFGAGYRVISPYGEIWCGERTDDPQQPNKGICDSATPVFMETGLSFGVARVLDLVLDFRFGLIKDKVSNKRPLTLLPGIRLWIDADSAFKIGVGIQLMMDFTKQDSEKQNRPTYGTPKQDSFDVGGRIYAQFQYDFLRYVGIFARISGTVGALRWIRVEIEGSGGVQARFP